MSNHLNPLRSILIVTIAATTALAQTEAPPDRPHVLKLQAEAMAAPFQIGVPGTAVPMPLIGSSARQTGAPYTAQSTLKTVQTLADGNRIEQTTVSTIARDSQGRVRTERSIVPVGITAPGSLAPQNVVTIEDPVAGANYLLDPNAKTFLKMGSIKESAEFKTGDFVKLKDEKALTLSLDATFVTNKGEVTNTDLGTQTIEGVSAKGTRITRTIPAGEIGNVNPIQITTETWFSPTLNMTVMSQSDDPRIGQTTYRLTNIQRTEPSPSLFQVPEDYTETREPHFVLSEKVMTAPKQ